MIITLKSTIKPSLYSRYFAEACNDWRGPSPRLSAGQYSSEETLQLWRAVGDTVFDLTDPGFEPRSLAPIVMS